MAEEPIRKEDIVDVDGILKGIQDIIFALNDLVNEQKKAVSSLRDTLKNANPATPEGQASIKQAVSDTEEFTRQSKAFSEIQKELTTRAKELAIAKGKTNKEYAAEVKALNSAKNAMAGNKRELDGAEGSINKIRARLKELTAEYNKLSPAARDKAAPAIKKLTDELKKAESAIGNNTRSVGNYKTAILSAAKSVIGFVSPIALVVAALNKMKEAFLSTEAGAKFLTKFQEGWKAFMYASKTPRSIKEIIGDVKEARQLGEELNTLRVKDRKENLEGAKLQNEINLLRFQAEKAGLKEIDQIKLLTEASQKEDKIIENKTNNLKDYLGVLEKLLIIMPENTDLLDEYNTKQIELEGITGEKSLRIASKISALKEKIGKDTIKDAKDINEAYYNWLIAHEEWLTEQTEKAIKDRTEIYKDYYDWYRDNVDKAITDEKSELDNYGNWLISHENYLKDAKAAIIDESFTIASNSISTLSDIYENAKKKELSAAGDNAVAREAIERKFAKKQQVLSIGEALINGAIAITEIWRKWAANPVVAGIFTALSSAMTLAQVGIIRSQKFARGGAGILEGPVHASGGIQIPGIGEAEGGEHFAVTSRAMTSKYGSKMLDAVSNSINQGKFFEVWANVSKTMNASDPYTKKMYELMSNTPTVYTDTMGNTVKEYPNGQKYVIRRFYKN